MIRSGESDSGIACLEATEDESRAVIIEGLHSLVPLGCIHRAIDTYKRMAFEFELTLNTVKCQ